MIRFPDAELFGFVDTTTEDVSCGGFSFLTRIPYTPAAGFYCNLMLPDRGTGKLALQCRARVISTASRRQGLYRVGCRIEDYFVLPDTATMSY
jgi:hypothetical protein